VQSLRGDQPGKLSALELEDLREHARRFEGFAAVRLSQYNLSGDGRPEVALASINTYDLFALLGASPLFGRTWPQSHDKTTVFEVVLGHGLWRRRFGGDPEIVGRSITLDSAPYTVLGVMAPGFEFPGGVEIYRRSPAGDYTSRATRNATIVGRMKPGVTLAAARAEVRAIGERLAEAYPDTNAGLSLTAGPLRELWIGNAGAYLRLLFAAVALVQLTVCANVVSLLLSRSLARRRDTAVRAALGASGMVIVRAWLVEGMVLGLLGAAIGVAVAFGLVSVARTLLPVELPYWMRVGVDLPMFGFTLLLGVLSGLVAGALPAVEAARADLATVLRDGTGATAGRSRQRVRRLLVAGQVALSVALVAGATFLARALVQLHRADLGFDPRDLLTLQVDPPWSRYHELWQTAPFYRRALEEIRALPGVDSAATNDALPLVNPDDVESRVALGIEGQSPDEERANPPANVQAVSPGYFTAMGVPLLRGRDFERHEGPEHAPAAVVSRRLAERFFPGQDAIGRRLRLAERGANFRPGSQPEARTGPWLTIVGVAGNVAQDSPAGSPGLDVYVSDQQSFVPETYVVVRARSGDPHALADSVRKAVLRVDPELAVFDVADMRTRVQATIWPQTLSGAAVSAFAGFALVLAALGLFGLLSLLVTQRAREIAIRMAVGAGRDDVARLVLGEAGGAVAAGAGLGIVGALVSYRFMAPLLGSGQGTEATIVTVPLTLAAVAVLAAWHPVRRALAVDPREALRAE
jgi:predicted permease